MLERPCGKGPGEGRPRRNEMLERPCGKKGPGGGRPRRNEILERPCGKKGPCGGRPRRNEMLERPCGKKGPGGGRPRRNEILERPCGKGPGEGRPRRNEIMERPCGKGPGEGRPRRNEILERPYGKGPGVSMLGPITVFCCLSHHTRGQALLTFGLLEGKLYNRQTEKDTPNPLWPVLGIREILVRIRIPDPRIRTSDSWIRIWIQLRIRLFLPTGTISSILKIYLFAKVLYLLVDLGPDPDREAQKHADPDPVAENV
jgi:hypothetical protein